MIKAKDKGATVAPMDLVQAQAQILMGTPMAVPMDLVRALILVGAPMAVPMVAPMAAPEAVRLEVGAPGVALLEVRALEVRVEVKSCNGQRSRTQSRKLQFYR